MTWLDAPRPCLSPYAPVLPPSVPAYQHPVSASAELLSQVTKLWQIDVLPFRNEKLITQSKPGHYSS